jgi:hypothetical protein
MLVQPCSTNALFEFNFIPLGTEYEVVKAKTPEVDVL